MADSPGDGTLQDALRDRYTIERELGRGGMATVYLARDLRHDRPVALKVLHPHLAASLGPDRFLREIRFAARLQHPHVLTVLDSGEAGTHTAGGARLWFTMPFVEGESLRDRLRREVQLPVEEAVRIAREAALALQYAHEHGVIHRDIKPENILLTSDGSTLVADFGIARALDGGNEEKLTETGLIVGTPAYMSPEQAAGERSLDARTDVYSLGVVLYEMLAGEPPYTGPTVQALLAKRVAGPVPSARATRPSVPEAVDRAVAKALAPIPADRLATAAELARALSAAAAGSDASSQPTSQAVTRIASPAASGRRPRQVALIGMGFVLGLGVLFGWLRTHGGPDATAGPSGAKLLAVLPFENVGATEDEYFADGMTDEVRGKLASLQGLQVIARSSSSQYKRTSKTPKQIGRELGVSYLLTGTVRWDKGAAGNHVRVSPELVQVSTGATRWQQPFDAALTDVFTVQAELAGQVAQALGVAIGAAQAQALAARPTGSTAAYDAYLKGEAASRSGGSANPEDLRKGIAFYEQAVAIDSGFVLAWAQLSRTHSSLYYNGTPTPDGERRAREAAERAVRLAPDHFAGHLALGDYFNSVPIRYDFPRARREYEAGLRSSPDNPDLLAESALVDMRTGRWEDAVRHLGHARVLDPRSHLVARRLAFAYVRLHRYEEASQATDHLEELGPGNLGVVFLRAMIRLAKGDLPGARAAITAASPATDPTALATFFGNYYDLYWVLPPGLQDVLLRAPPAAYDGDRGIWGLVRAETYRLQGDSAGTRIYADSARDAMAAILRATPNEPQRLVFHALALAYLGRKAEAIAEGERAAALMPISRDAYDGTYIQHQLVRIYLATGEYEQALDRLEPLLRTPYHLTPAWLGIDPTFDPVRQHPRFRRLVEGAT